MRGSFAAVGGPFAACSTPHRQRRSVTSPATPVPMPPPAKPTLPAASAARAGRFAISVAHWLLRRNCADAGCRATAVAAAAPPTRPRHALHPCDQNNSLPTIAEHCVLKQRGQGVSQVHTSTLAYLRGSGEAARWLAACLQHNRASLCHVARVACRLTSSRERRAHALQPRRPTPCQQVRKSSSGHSLLRPHGSSQRCSFGR